MEGLGSLTLKTCIVSGSREDYQKGKYSEDCKELFVLSYILALWPLLKFTKTKFH